MSKITLIFLIVLLSGKIYTQIDKANEFNNNGIKLLQNKEFIKAIECFDKSIAIAPYIPNYFLNRANAYSGIDSMHLALIDYNTAIDIDSSYGIAYFNRAMVNYKLRNFKEACTDWKIAYKYEIEDSKLHLEKYCNYSAEQLTFDKLKKYNNSEIKSKNIDYYNVYQSDSIKNNDNEVVEEKPEFPGGADALLQFVARNVVFPEFAKENEIQGRVYVGFSIDIDGKVTNVKLLKGVHPVLNKEAIKVVTKLPDFKPATQNGKPVKVSYQIPISFKLYGGSAENNENNFVLKGKKILEKGLELYNNKDYFNALITFNELLTFDPYNVNAMYNRALVNYSMRNYIEGCDDWINAAQLGNIESRELLKKYCNEKNILSNYHDLGLDLLKNKDYSNVIKCYNIILQIDSDDTVALYNRASTFLIFRKY